MHVSTWDSLKANRLFEDLITFKDLFPKSEPSESPKDRANRHEIDLKPYSLKHCVMKHWPLPRAQVTAIENYFSNS